MRMSVIDVDLWLLCTVCDELIFPFRIRMSGIAVDLWPTCMVYDIFLFSLSE